MKNFNLNICIIAHLNAWLVSVDNVVVWKMLKLYLTNNTRAKTNALQPCCHLCHDRNGRSYRNHVHATLPWRCTTYYIVLHIGRWLHGLFIPREVTKNKLISQHKEFVPGSFPFKAIHMTEIVIKSDGRHQRNDLQHINFRDKLFCIEQI